MKALISTIEPREFTDPNTNQTISGYRVAQVESDDAIFSVADALFWTDCADNVVQDQFLYEPNLKQIIAIPNPSTITAKPDQPTTTGTTTL